MRMASAAFRPGKEFSTADGARTQEASVLRMLQVGMCQITKFEIAPEDFYLSPKYSPGVPNFPPASSVVDTFGTK